MATIESLVPYIASEVKDAMFLVIERELIQTARKFFEQSMAWKDDKNLHAVVSGDEFVSLFIPDEANMVSVDYVLFDDLDIYPVTEYELNLTTPEWREDTGPPTNYIVQLNEARLRLYPKSNLVGTIKYQLILKPSMSATEIPDFAVDQFIDVLIDGTLSRLYGMTGKSWSNPMEAERRGKMFRNGVSLARERMLRGASMQNDFPIITLV